MLSSICRPLMVTTRRFAPTPSTAKGRSGFLAIRQAIGAEAFETALHDVATHYAWAEMTPEQLREAFERASGQDLEVLWSHWFDETALTKAEIDALAKTFDE